MTRFSRVLATPLLSAAIFGATFGLAGTASADMSGNNNRDIQEFQDPRTHQTLSLR